MSQANQHQEGQEAAVGATVRIFTFRQAKAVSNQPAPTFLQVAMSGTLQVENNCLIVAAERKYALVFREGTATYDPAKKALSVEGRNFSVGSSVKMGGPGGSAVESLLQGDPKQVCGVDNTWVVVPGTFKPAA